jgi:hypothetical protein
MSKAAWTIVAVAVVALIGLAVYVSLYTVPKMPGAQTQFDYYGSNDWWSPSQDGDERRRRRQHRRQQWPH